MTPGRATRVAGAALGLASAWWLAGCAQPVRAAAALPALEVLSSRPARPGDELRAPDIEPLTASSARWAVAGSAGSFEVRTVPAGDAVTRTDSRGERSLAAGPDGSVTLRWQRDRADGARTSFDPPLLLAPPVLRPDAPASSASAVRTERAGVADRDDGSAVRDVRIASVDRIRTPLGEFEAVRVDAVLSMKVPFASMRRESSAWIRPGTGPVAVRSDERILVMGVVPRNTSETRVLLPAGATP
jgi:hypothetical protein